MTNPKTPLNEKKVDEKYTVYTIVPESELQLERELRGEEPLLDHTGYIPHVHTPNGWTIILDDQYVCHCDGVHYDEYVHKFNVAVPRDCEFVYVPADYFQSAENGVQGGIDEFIPHIVKALVDRGVTDVMVQAKIEEVAKIIANVIDTASITLHMYRRAVDWTDMWMIFLTAYKLLTGHNVSDILPDLQVALKWVKALAQDQEDEEPASQVQGFTDDLRALREGLETYKSIRKSTFVKTIKRLMKYSLAFGLFAKLGLTFSNLHYDAVEEAYIKQKFTSGSEFIFDILDGTIFFLERAAQALELKSWTPFLYNSASCSKWTEKAFEIKSHYKMFTANNNPEVTYSSLLQEMQVAISEGEQLTKVPGLEPIAKRVATQLLQDLRFLNCEMTSTTNNQKTRTPPFAEMICGDSSVGKTLFTSLLDLHFARVTKLPEGTEFQYHRNPGETHWNGYKPYMHTIVYDDAAAANPNAMVGVDPSVGELISVINPNPTSANMADLESKGHSPLHPEHVSVNTNIEDLHASVYYSFPLALRRRLPYVITISPRFCTEEDGTVIDYRRDDSPTMLDPVKLPLLMPGDYPNQWNIQVQQVRGRVPEGTNKRTEVALTPGEKFTDIYAFLEWYTAAIENHRELAAKMNKTLTCMADLGEEKQMEYCMHHMPAKHCSQCQNPIQGFMGFGDVEVTSDSDDSDAEYLETQPLGPLGQFNADVPEVYNGQEETFWNLISDGAYFAYYLAKAWVAKIKAGVAKVTDIACEKLRAIVISSIKSESVKYMKEAGQSLWDKITANSPLKWFLLALPIVATMTFLGSMFFGGEEKKEEDKPTQGPISSKYGKPMVVVKPDREENPWYNKDFKVASFDVPEQTSSWKGFDADELQKHLAPNVISFSVKAHNNGVVSMEYPCIHALGLGGHLFVTNNHLMPSDREIFLHVVHGVESYGVNINKDETLGESSLFRMPERDLVFFELGLPPRQDIRRLLVAPELPIKCEGVYYQRDMTGYVTQNKVKALLPTGRVHTQLSAESIPIWVGQAETQTVNGDCGSVLIGLAAFGPFIAGLHVAGGVTQEIEAVRLDKDVVELATAHFETPIISCNTVNLAAKDVLGPLHPKSIFRYTDGHARVFGSIPHRSTMRSNVKPTVLAPVLEQYGWQQTHGAPMMKGYQPWHHAVDPTLKHPGKIRKDILRQAADAYLQDIFTKIPEEEFKQLQVLDDLEAINGVPGLKYMEGINRSSSMGYPWQKSKKFMLVDVDDSRWQDGQTFTDEAWDEIDRMMKDYEAHRVAHPVFVGQLKDEAVALKKVVIGKTRVFLIASGAWTIIMRKFFMGFIRLFQRYRTVFEGMPGLTTQSAAWGKLFRHLTKFGEDRLFAGDFEKYDKMMESVADLECYRVMYKVVQRAGWPQIFLDIFWGICEDASFPVAIVNGDVMQFEGTNPSGQAITVVLNCIMNSLYMRYVYILRNPEHEAVTFQLYVHLITYGDDNAGSVSAKITWFNHTAIQEELYYIGINYTMADKVSDSRPFINICEVDFLKRKWRFDEEMNDYLAPLCEESIKKRLMIGVQSSELTPEWQAVQNLQLSMEDYFMYGREEFEKQKSFLMKVGEESGLHFHMATVEWPTFDGLKKRWFEATADFTEE